VRADLPTGTVTFLFTDVEGSTGLLHELGAERYAKELAAHRRVVRGAIGAHGGVEIDTQGDAFFIAFPTAPGALQAAAAALAGLDAGPISVRMGLHTGTPLLTDEGYVGSDVHRAARIAAAGHGGQVLVSASTARLVDTALTDLGEHRFKDLSAPEHVYQLGGGAFSPLKSLYRTNLPVPATVFLGRERELAEVGSFLLAEDARLLTLTGPGGTGKTRLALQAAAEASDAYPQGVYWVPLAPLRDPELVLQGAAQALGAEDSLAEHIADKRLLVLFDNFEHIIGAAVDVARLLGSCPNLQVLVTSREPLHVSGEQEYPVPPLAPREGVEFFRARARAIRPDFQDEERSVSEICRRLDDLPLALELAAARVKALSTEQILDRLEQHLPLLTGGARDLPERHRTLRATIEWSHELLTDDERRLFARLAVFRGGCRLEAAEQIAGADLDTIHSLVDKSLLRYTGHRYWMLETIREYATERLEASDDANEIRRRHAKHFLALAEEADPYLREAALRGPLHGLGQWLDLLAAEHDNLRAALYRLGRAGETQLVLRMVGALAEFWYVSDHIVELRSWLPAALAADERPTSARAKALIGPSGILAMSEDLAGLKRRAEEALALYRMLGDRSGTADALWRLGYTVASDGDHLTARPFLEESIGHFSALGDHHSLVNVTRTLAWGYLRLGDRDRARALYTENLANAREFDNKLVEGRSLGGLAQMINADEGRAEEAFALAQQQLQIARDFGPSELSAAVSRVARVLANMGRLASAARIISCSEALIEEVGAAEPWIVEQNEQTRTMVREGLGETAFAEAWDQGRVATIDEAASLALRELELNA
jgi:predicted ATPase